MAIPTLLILSVALAVDAFAVAVAAGIQLRCISLGQTARMAATFGFFQFLMPVVGWFLGVGVQSYISEYDHWIAFFLLAFIAFRMLKESLKQQNACACANDGVPEKDPTRGLPLLLLGIATSIDALAVGISLAILGHQVLSPALVIGVVCFVLTACGIHLGRFICSISTKFEKYANTVSALVLLAIGFNILREHGVFD